MAYTPRLEDIEEPKTSYSPSLEDIEEEKPRSFLSKLPMNLLAGLAQGGHETLNTPYNIAKSLDTGSKDTLASKLGIKTENIPHQKDYDYSELLGIPEAKKTFADKLVQAFSQGLPGALLPEAKIGLLGKIPGVGRFIQKAVGNAIPVSAYSAIQNPEAPSEAAKTAAETTLPFSAANTIATSMNPYARLLGRAGLGVLGGTLGYEGAKQAKLGDSLADLIGAGAGGVAAMLGVKPATLAKEKMLQGVEKTPYQEKLAAADRLGLKYLTPAEASGNPFVAAQQGAAGKTTEGSQLLYNRGKERLESERSAINKLFDTIYDKDKLDPEVKELYKKSYEKSIPQDYVDSLKENEVFNSAIKNVLKKPAYQESLKGVPENSIGYLDHVKQAMDDMIESAPKKEARLLKQTRQDLVNKMDEFAPEYKKARSLAERGIARTKLEEALNQKDVRGTNFYNKILKNDKTFNKFKFSLRNSPEAQQQLEDMRKIFGDLINPPTVRTAAGLANTGMRQNRNSITDFVALFKNKLTGGKYDKAAIELITNPKWADELHKLATLGNKRKAIGGLLDLLGRTTATTRANMSPMTLNLNNFAGYEK